MRRIVNIRLIQFALLVNDVYECLPNSDSIDTMLNIETDNDNDDHVQCCHVAILFAQFVAGPKLLQLNPQSKYRNRDKQLDVFLFTNRNCDLSYKNAFKSSKVYFN